MDKTNFKYANETIETVNKQTYLGIEMTSSGRYAYARKILSKMATKIVLNDYSQTLILQRSWQGKNFSMPLLIKPVLLYGCEIWRPELLSYKTHFDKSAIKHVHIKFCKCPMVQRKQSL